MTPEITWNNVETLNIDFDHTITEASSDEYLPPHQQTPNRELIEKMWDAYYDGKTIIVWTARPWRDAGELAGVLTMWDVPFHGVMMAKGGSDKYVDDKAVRPDEFIAETITKADQSRLDEL